jgi:hypothetical protein
MCVYRTILQAVIVPRQGAAVAASVSTSAGHLLPPSQRMPQLIMASATLTSGVKALLEDVQGFRWDLPGAALCRLSACQSIISLP